MLEVVRDLRGRGVEAFPDIGAWMIRDLQSKNGTLVNDRPIAATVRLVAGDSIQVGGTRFLLERAQSSDGGANKDDSTGVRVLSQETDLETSHILRIPVEDDPSEITDDPSKNSNATMSDTTNGTRMDTRFPMILLMTIQRRETA